MKWIYSNCQEHNAALIQFPFKWNLNPKKILPSIPSHDLHSNNFGGDCSEMPTFLTTHWGNLSPPLSLHGRVCENSWLWPLIQTLLPPLQPRTVSECAETWRGWTPWWRCPAVGWCCSYRHCWSFFCSLFPSPTPFTPKFCQIN